jgi:hypothetical protein
MGLLRDIYNIVAAGVPGTYPDGRTGGILPSFSSPCQPEGGFYVLYDEAAETAESQAREEEEQRGG